MNKTIIYVTGSPGFKRAVLTRPDIEMKYVTREIGDELVSFTLPKNETLEDLKASIGEEIQSNHNLLFLHELPVNGLPSAEFSYIPGQPVKMSIWVRADSKVGGNKRSN